MQAYNQDSYGEKVRVRFNSDISTATSYKIYLEPRQGDEIEKTATLGTSDVYEGDQFYGANKYIEYTTEEDVFEDYAGTWRKKGLAVFASSELSTEYQKFLVTE